MTEEIRQVKTIDDLLNFPIVQEIEKLKVLFQKLQENLYAVASSNDDSHLVRIKIGTVLTFAILRKLGTGIAPGQFTSNDWVEIADTVSEYAILKDGEDYSSDIFNLYADYIQWSASLYEGRLEPQKIQAIKDLSEEIIEKTEQLQREGISEAEYVETCLWICLEAMVKLLSSLVYLSRVPGLGDAVQAATMLCYEYGRLKLYSREQAILSDYIRNQHHLGAELQANFETFKAELDSDSAVFATLIDRAFDSSFREALKASAELALTVGVEEQEVLMTQEDVDSFFMD